MHPEAVGCCLSACIVADLWGLGVLLCGSLGAFFGSCLRLVVLCFILFAVLLTKHHVGTTVRYNLYTSRDVCDGSSNSGASNSQSHPPHESVTEAVLLDRGFLVDLGSTTTLEPQRT